MARPNLVVKIQCKVSKIKEKNQHDVLSRITRDEDYINKILKILELHKNAEIEKY